MTGNRRSFVEDSVSASPTISLVKIVVKVGSVSCCRVWPTVGMWSGQPVVVSNVVVCYDDIDVFLSVLG
jgi:hypothetical protein